MPDDEITEEGRRARFERWEAIGVEYIKADLLNGGHRYVGGTPAVRQLAREWVRMKEAEAKASEKKPAPEVVSLKPSFYGVSVDLRALWRKIRGKQ